MAKLLPIVFVLLIGGIFIFLIGPRQVINRALPEQLRQDLGQTGVSSTAELKDFKYIGGERDCCVCSGLTSLYKYNGGSEKIFDTLIPMALNHDLAYVTKALKQFNLQGKLHLGYYYQGVTKETRSEMLKNFEENLADPQKQISLFKSENEALETLKSLIAANKPVMFAWEDNQKVGNPQEECQDDTYNVAVGLDENKITFYTLPGVKSSSSLAEFKKKWQLQNSQFCYWVFPGNYPIMWLEK